MSFVAGVIEVNDVVTIAKVGAKAATYNNANVGDDKTVTMAVAVSGSHSNNYSVVKEKTTTGNITPRSIAYTTFSVFCIFQTQYLVFGSVSIIIQN